MSQAPNKMQAAGRIMTLAVWLIVLVACLGGTIAVLWFIWS